MSDRDLAIKLIEQTPDYKIGYIIAYLQGLNADEETDDRYCEQLWEDYLNAPDPQKDKEYTLSSQRGT